MTRIQIDPNVRVRGNQTFSGFEDVEGTTWELGVGDAVEVFEPEAGIVGPARVTELDLERRLIYLAVEWAQLRQEAEVSTMPC